MQVWTKARCTAHAFPCAYSQQTSAMVRLKLVFSLFFIRKERTYIIKIYWKKCVVRVKKSCIKKVRQTFHLRNAGGVQGIDMQSQAYLDKKWLVRYPTLVAGKLRLSCWLQGYYFAIDKPPVLPGENASPSVNEHKLSCLIFSRFLSFSL